ncbi:aldehyde dehydrogenase family protein [Blastococcus mobilis]|uniref:Acyl-CoA reductase n=1 Tax=Blastococcus mobilis TaxID=1938746 RepID=A0A239AJE4_9ACTN|nr:aldehyde dehydrogenase family protein [Blastococcus mobilis]SNR95785.1 Acyl-CoA reductase [Blastococcus mobilis]
MRSAYEVFDPATREIVGHAPDASPADVDAVVRRADAARRHWGSLTSGDRRAALRACAAAVRQAEQRLGRILSLEQGKPLAEAVAEFQVGAGLLEYYAALEWDDVERLPDRQGRSIEIHHAPVGVVATITPWNFPISLLLVKLAPALLAGCAVVAKPSESTPLSTMALVELLADFLPADVVQCVTGRGKDVNVALSEHSGVRKLSFTGSTGVGTAIAAQAAATVKRLTLELGGNDPAIVLDDADVAVAAAGIVGSAFRNAGQVCMAVKRVYVPAALEPALVEAVAAAVQRHVLGHGVDPGTTMGPMHTEAQRAKVLDLVARAQRDGARVVSGGVPACGLPGWFLAPTVVSGAKPGMDLVDEEQFGNALPVVAYSDLESLVESLNTEAYGLGASVWSPDLDRARAVAGTLEVGTVWINQHTVVEPDAPFGGWKSSGLGRERGRWGLDEYLEPRTVNVRSHTVIR